VFRRQSKSSHHGLVGQVVEQGGLADPALADDGCALMGAGGQPVDDLADLVLAAMESFRFFDWVAEGEGVHRCHSCILMILWQVWNFIQVPERNIIVRDGDRWKIGWLACFSFVSSGADQA